MARARIWVLETIPALPDSWIGKIADEETANGHHPGRLDGILSDAANRCRTATQRGGGPVRATVTSKWPDDRRFELYVHEIRELRTMISID
ncbi:MAG TPA: hypothetical protein VK030_07775 [Actinomycetales bacterium]|nr:hypothetical protein [Actinomycetales bacterium]